MTLLIIINMITNLLLLALVSALLVSNKRIQSWWQKLKKSLWSKKDNELLSLKNFSKLLSGVLVRLSNDVVGALIVIEGEDVLNDYVQLGYKVDADFSSEFVTNIFYNKSSPLHDGGMILRGEKIIAVSSYFPMTKKNLVTAFGARHRAAVGISEETDALVFLVSETSGKIAVVHRGEIVFLPKVLPELAQKIYTILKNKEMHGNDKLERLMDSNL